MPREVQLEQSPPTLLSGMFDGWIQVLTRPNREEYLDQISKANFLKTFLGVSIFGLLVGLYANTVGNTPLIVGHQNVVIGILFSYVLIVGSFYTFNLLLLGVMKLFGGAGTYPDQCALLAALLTPLGTVLLLLLALRSAFGFDASAIFNPLSLTGILGVILLLLAVYGAGLLLFALSVIYNVKATRGLYALGVLAGIYAAVRVTIMFTTHQETLITRMWTFLSAQWRGGYLQELMMNHIWLVLFSILVAVIVGVVIGVLITMPSRRPKISHLVFVIPVLIFFVIWAASSGLFGAESASQIATTMRAWDRSLESIHGFFGEVFVILGSILRKPDAVGLLGMGFTAILYVLLLAGEKASDLTLYVAGIILTIPSIALFGVLIKPLGIGAFNAAFALILYAQLPILRNTYTGIKEVQPEIVEAGRGMGMTEFQLLIGVKLPLAVPVIMTGLRVSLVMLVGIAAIAAFIGNDTLGDYIFTGIQRAQDVRYITGAFVVAVLAVIVDFILGIIQDRLTPTGLKERRNNG